MIQRSILILAGLVVLLAACGPDQKPRPMLTITPQLESSATPTLPGTSEPSCPPTSRLASVHSGGRRHAGQHRAARGNVQRQSGRRELHGRIAAGHGWANPRRAQTA